MSENVRMPEGQKVTENIYLCPDGKYRWTYELNMLKNPVILFTVWKICGIVLLILLLFSFLLEVFDGDAAGWVTGFLLTPGILIVPGIMLLLTAAGYLILAAVYGWKYMVLFEMDDKEVVHHQMPVQFQKAQALSWLAAMAGAASGSFTAAGSGMAAAAKSSSVSSFEKVTKVVCRKRFHTIMVNEALEKNQIYASDADYEFVKEHILSRCVRARGKG